MVKKKLPREDRSISYAIDVQNIVLSLIGVSSLIFLFLFLFTNPYQNSWAFSLFWINLFIFLGGIICYFQFWYFFSLKSSIIYVNSVNKMLFSSAVYSSLLTLMFSLIHTDQLNYLSSIMVITLFLLAYFYYR